MPSDVFLLDLLKTAEVFDTYSYKLRLSHEDLLSLYNESRKEVDTLSNRISKLESDLEVSERSRKANENILTMRLFQSETELRVAKEAIDALSRVDLRQEISTCTKSYDNDVLRFKHEGSIKRQELFAKEFEERIKLFNEANDAKLCILLSRIEALTKDHDDGLRLGEENLELSRELSEINGKLTHQAKEAEQSKNEYLRMNVIANEEILRISEELDSLKRRNCLVETASCGYQAQCKFLERKLVDMNSVISVLKERIHFLEIQSHQTKNDFSRAPTRDRVDLEDELLSTTTECDILRLQMKSLESKIRHMKTRESELVKQIKMRIGGRAVLFVNPNTN